MQDVADNDYLNSFRAPHRGEESNQSGADNDVGFVVKGAPWEQRNAVAPNTASVEEFPSIPGFNTPPPAIPTRNSGVWGSKR